MIVQLQERLRQSSSFSHMEFTETQLDLFYQYYELVLKWNKYLHLTTLTSPLQFAERHILESTFAVSCLDSRVLQIWDIGSGCGTPGIPLAILCPDLQVTLVEANKKKAIFLKDTAGVLGMRNLRVINARFESLKNLPADSCLTSRALESLNEHLPALFHLGAAGQQLLFFVGNQGAEHLKKITLPNWQTAIFPLPQTKNRLLFSLTRST